MDFLDALNPFTSIGDKMYDGFTGFLARVAEDIINGSFEWLFQWVSKAESPFIYFDNLENIFHYWQIYCVILLAVNWKKKTLQMAADMDAYIPFGDMVKRAGISIGAIALGPWILENWIYELNRLTIGLISYTAKVITVEELKEEMFNDAFSSVFGAVDKVITLGVIFSLVFGILLVWFLFVAGRRIVKMMLDYFALPYVASCYMLETGKLEMWGREFSSTLNANLPMVLCLTAAGNLMVKMNDPFDFVVMTGLIYQAIKAEDWIRKQIYDLSGGDTSTMASQMGQYLKYLQ